MTVGSPTDSTDIRIRQMHESHMRKALLQAKKAGALMETPIGAVIVKDGVVVASGYNQRESRQDVTLHAELTAIRKACRRLGSWRLDGCDLYVTLEPCIMCAGAIQQAKLRKVYFGALQPKSGGVVSKTAILDLDLNHSVEYEGGILADESETMMKEFFALMRISDKSTGLTKGQRRNRNKSKT
ncbi:MAG: nucleoside deaminase [Saccharofermentanales bacterium]